MGKNVPEYKLRDKNQIETEGSAVPSRISHLILHA